MERLRLGLQWLALFKVDRLDSQPGVECVLLHLWAKRQDSFALSPRHHAWQGGCRCVRYKVLIPCLQNRKGPDRAAKVDYLPERGSCSYLYESRYLAR